MSGLARRSPLLSPELLRFVLSGGTAAAANVLSRVLFSLVLPYSAAILLAYLVGMATAYALMRRFVFARSGRGLHDEMARFAAVNLLAAAQVWAVSMVLSLWLLPMIGATWHAELLAHVAGVGSTVLTSYAAHRHFTFADRARAAGAGGGALLAVLILLVAGGAAGALLFLPLGDWLRALRAFLVGLGPAGYVLFFLIQVAATATVAPSAPFSVVAGVMLGLAGLPMAVAAATCGAAIAFLASRHFARAWAERWMARHTAFRALDRAVDATGWRIVGLTRLSPLIPFNVQNYLFGLTRVGFWPFVVATIVGILPNTAACVYLGMIGRTSIGEGGAISWVLSAVGLVATVLAVVLLSRAATRGARAVIADRPDPD